jgi:predicted nucleic acid-binding protein
LVVGKAKHSFSLNKLAKAEGLQILDGVGLLETFYARGYLPDLRTSSRQSITRNVYIDQRLLDRRLRALGRLRPSGVA